MISSHRYQNIAINQAYHQKTPEEKNRIVQEFPPLNSRSTENDIFDLLMLLEKIQHQKNLSDRHHIDSDDLLEIMASLKKNWMECKAISEDYHTQNRDDFFNDLLLAATHDFHYPHLPDFQFKFYFHSFSFVNYTKTMKNIIDKIKQQFCVYPNGDLFVGSYNALGKRTGYGKKTEDDGRYYLGEWENEKPAGSGEFHFADGSFYKGHWKDGLFHGTGLLQRKENASYDGCWKKGMRHGKGSLLIKQDHVKIKITCSWTNNCIQFSEPASITILNQFDEILLDQKAFFKKIDHSDHLFLNLKKTPPLFNSFEMILEDHVTLKKQILHIGTGHYS